MAVLGTENNRFSHVVKEEQWPSKGWCRKAVTANEATAKEYVIGTVLGKVISGGAATAEADSGNTGDGAMGAITVSAGAVIGDYRLVIVAAATDAGTFLVSDPNGKLVGTGTVGSAFALGGLSFTLADGAADFVVGDGFTINVTGSYKYKVAVETATDGSEVPAGVVLKDQSVAATTDTVVLMMIRGDAILDKNALVLDATFDNAAKKQKAYDALEALGITLEESA